MKSTGKKERTSLSKLSKRKKIIKRKPLKNKSNHSSTSSKKLILQLMRKKKMMKLKKMRKEMNKFLNQKDNMKSPMNCMKILFLNHSNISQELLEVTLETLKDLMRLDKNKRRKNKNKSLRKYFLFNKFRINQNQKREKDRMLQEISDLIQNKPHLFINFIFLLSSYFICCFLF